MVPHGPDDPVFPSRGGSPYARMDRAPKAAGKGYFPVAAAGLSNIELTVKTYGRFSIDATDELPLGLQLTLNAPVGAVQLSLSIEPRYELGATWRVYLRRDRAVRIGVDAGGVDVTADHTFGDSPRTVKLTTSSSPPLIPGSVYYVALVYAAPDSELFAITGSVQVDPTVTPDAGLPDASTGSDAGPLADATVPPDGYQPGSLTERDGCGCQSTGNATNGAPLALLLLFLVLLGLRHSPWRRSRRSVP